MKTNKNTLYFFIYCFLFSITFPTTIQNNNWIKNIYFKNTIHLGYDSNVLKYSENERGGYSSSEYIALKPSLYTYLQILK